MLESELFDEIHRTLSTDIISNEDIARIAEMGIEALPILADLFDSPFSISEHENAGLVMVKMGTIAVGPMMSMIRAGQLGCMACLYLEQIQDPRVIPFLLELLQSDDDDANEWAAFAIGDLHVSEAVPLLIRKLGSENPEVRVNAVRALGKIGNMRAVGPLKTLLESGRATSIEVRDLEAIIARLLKPRPGLRNEPKV